VKGMAHSAAGLHGLLPIWLELLGAVLFGAIALSHLRHMVQTAGQRRPWHACHVLMAVAMACMYAPGHGTHLPAVPGLWRVALAAAGLLAAAWAWWGAAESLNPVWLLTALDLGAMLYMWSPGPSSRAASALVMLYLLGDAVMWTLDVHRSLERQPSLLRWLPLADPRGGTLATAVLDARAGALLGDLDISPSMVVMSLGMAYMLLAMGPVG
jgi:hypothetical protein